MKRFFDVCGVCETLFTEPLMDSVPSLGFQKVVTIEQLSQQHPLLDMVDHSRKARVQVRRQVTPGPPHPHLLSEAKPLGH